VKLFEDMLREAGVPVSEDEMQARWKQLNEQEGSRITNDSKWSPFWRLIAAIVTEPCRQLVNLLATKALPNTFLQYAAGAWLDVFAWGVDLERKLAVPAEGTVTFTRDGAAGELTIAAGTVVESPTLDGRVYRLTVTADTTIPDGTVSAAVPVRAEQAGAAYNLGPGYYSILPGPVPGIASAANEADWLSTPGADGETDEELRLRCRNQFSAVGQYHHDAAYRASIATFAGIRTDYIFFEHGAPRGPGSANCYIMLENGAPPQDFIDAVNIHVRDEGNHGHGDDLVCYPMPETLHALTATVYPVANLPADRRTALLTEVENMIRCAFRENSDYDVTKTWPFDRFSLSRLDKELHARLDDLKSVEFDRQADIVSGMELPRLSTLTVAEGA
jgi:uncharacterized phage protein gp47/JayE